jgi:chaperonin cofactor prefoldin
MIDYEFIELMFKKYSKHLQDVVNSIETLIDGYDKQLTSLYKLPKEKYGNYIKELENKKAEAFKKLADISPNMEKMSKQLDEIQEIIHNDNH